MPVAGVAPVVVRLNGPDCFIFVPRVGISVYRKQRLFLRLLHDQRVAEDEARLVSRCDVAEVDRLVPGLVILEWRVALRGHGDFDAPGHDDLEGGEVAAKDVAQGRAGSALDALVRDVRALHEPVAPKM